MKANVFSGVLLAAAVVVGPTFVPAFADGLIDPTRPHNARKSSPGQPAPQASRVTAILMSGDRRVAVFDGRVVKAGDRIGDVFIESVLADGVRFRRDGRVEFARMAAQAVSVRQKTVSEESEP